MKGDEDMADKKEPKKDEKPTEEKSHLEKLRERMVARGAKVDQMPPNTAFVIFKR
jgi:hypothetical protein